MVTTTFLIISFRGVLRIVGDAFVILEAAYALRPLIYWIRGECAPLLKSCGLWRLEYGRRLPWRDAIYRCGSHGLDSCRLGLVGQLLLAGLLLDFDYARLLSSVGIDLDRGMYYFSLESFQVPLKTVDIIV